MPKDNPFTKFRRDISTIGNFKLSLFVILFSIIGILVLYFISLNSLPANISLSEVKNYEGKEVIVHGIVFENYGNDDTLLKIKDVNFSVLIFSEEKLSNIEIGDEIQAKGIAQKYKGEYEIVVKSKNDIKILKKWSNEFLSLKELAENPEKYEGVNVNVIGYIKFQPTINDKNATISLTDNLTNSSVVLKVEIKNLNKTLKQEFFVNVRGKFVYDGYNLKYFILVNEEKHGVWIL